MKQRIITAFVAALTASLPASAYGQEAPTQAPAAADPGAVETIVERASAAFDAGDFDGAVAAFEEAYRLDPQPRFLFNIGRIHEEAGEIELAIDHYRRFVRQPGVELEQRERASQRIEVLARVQSAMEPTPPPPVVTAVAPTPDVAPRLHDDVEAGHHSGRGTRNAGIAVLAVGAGVLSSAVVTGVLAQRTSTDLSAQGDPMRRRELVDRGERLALGTDVLLGVGAALAITGAVLTVVGAVRMRRPAGRRVAVRGLALAGRF